MQNKSLKSSKMAYGGTNNIHWRIALVLIEIPRSEWWSVMTRAKKLAGLYKATEDAKLKWIKRSADKNRALKRTGQK
jgi:hypothetical protein